MRQQMKLQGREGIMKAKMNRKERKKEKTERKEMIDHMIDPKLNQIKEFLRQHKIRTSTYDILLTKEDQREKQDQQKIQTQWIDIKKEKERVLQQEQEQNKNQEQKERVLEIRIEERTQRNPRQQTDTNLIYGDLVVLETDENPPDDDQKKKAIGFNQTIIDQATTQTKVKGYYELEKRMITSPFKKITKVLTYFTENRITSASLNDLNNDLILDPVGSTGEWIGIARLYLTPLTLGYETLKKLSETSLFSKTSPFVVRLVSVTFSLESIRLQSQEIAQRYRFIGPCFETLTSLGLQVGYISPERIEGKEKIQDAGDSFLVQKVKSLETEGSEGTETKTILCFCGVGLTTRTQEGYEDNGNLPLYESGMQQRNGTWNQNTSLCCGIPSTTSQLSLTSVKTGPQFPTNTYEIQYQTEKTTWTAKEICQFQENQTSSKESISGCNLPIWGGIQVQIARQSLNGMIRNLILSQSQSDTTKDLLTEFESAVLNVNLVFSVQVGYLEQ